MCVNKKNKNQRHHSAQLRSDHNSFLTFFYKRVDSGSPKRRLNSKHHVRMFSGKFSIVSYWNISIFSAQISPGSKASTVDLSPGDIILAIDGVSTSNMMHCEAQNRMKQVTRQLNLTIQRSEVMIQMTSFVSWKEANQWTKYLILLQARNQTVVTSSQRR